MQKSDQLTQSVGLQQLGHMSVILLHGGNDPYRNHVAQHVVPAHPETAVWTHGGSFSSPLNNNSSNVIYRRSS